MKTKRTLTKTLLTLMLLSLCVGLLPPAALAAEDDAAFRVASVEGTVTVKTASGRTMPVTENMPLRGGWTVETAPASYATLNLDGVPAISLGADTKIELRQNAERKMMELYVSKGVVVFDFLDAPAEDGTFILHTPTALADIRGTFGEAKVVSPMCTQMCLLAGSTEVANSVQLFAAPEEEDTVGAAETSAQANAGAIPDWFVAYAVSVQAQILTVRSGYGRTTVFVENTQRQVVVNGVTVPSGSKAEVPQAGAAPKVSPMTPADRQELGASLAARGGDPSSSNGQGAVPATGPSAPGGNNSLADDTNSLSVLRPNITLLDELTSENASSVTMEFLLMRAGGYYDAAQSARERGGEEAYEQLLKTLRQSAVTAVKEIERRKAAEAAAAAQAAAEAEAANNKFQTEQAAKAAEENKKVGVGGTGTVNTWGGNSSPTTDDDDDDDYYEPAPTGESGGNTATDEPGEPTGYDEGGAYVTD